jgi:hypothetical protein
VSTVELRPGELLIDGTPRILLSASVFPFRIPSSEWESRLNQVAELGYNSVDVYIPWNVHETEPGRWDFTGERDVEEFLQLCTAAGLLVIARPGPYICSEWDGGALPARLGTIPGLQLRQNESRYLAEVDTWFDQILPRLAKQQVTSGGPVVMVQLENELDFFDCDDPQGYMTHLTASAQRHGIDVPLIACVGQGDIQRASGEAADVVPTVNLYPDDGSTDVEKHTAYYFRALHERGLPLLVPETNRLHRTLKRMLVSGVRLLGPYLQSSGWNPAYGTSVNNWGDLLAFMTHDYDFGGMVASDGSARPDAQEARILAGVVEALGPRLAGGAPQGDASGVQHTLDVPPQALALAGGGELLAVTELGDTPTPATVMCGDHQLQVTVPAGGCQLLLRDMPLGVGDARLLLSSAELTGMTTTEREARLELTTRGEAQVVLSIPHLAALTCSGGLVSTTPADGPDGVVTITGTQGGARREAGADTILGARAPLDDLGRREAASAGEIRTVLASKPSAEPVVWRQVQDEGPPPLPGAPGRRQRSGALPQQRRAARLDARRGAAPGRRPRAGPQSADRPCVARQRRRGPLGAPGPPDGAARARHAHVGALELRRPQAALLAARVTARCRRRSGCDPRPILLSTTREN